MKAMRFISTMSLASIATVFFGLQFGRMWYWLFVHQLKIDAFQNTMFAGAIGAMLWIPIITIGHCVLLGVRRWWFPWSWRFVLCGIGVIALEMLWHIGWVATSGITW